MFAFEPVLEPGLELPDLKVDLAAAQIHNATQDVKTLAEQSISRLIAMSTIEFGALRNVNKQHAAFSAHSDWGSLLAKDDGQKRRLYPDDLCRDNDSDLPVNGLHEERCIWRGEPGRPPVCGGRP